MSKEPSYPEAGFAELAADFMNAATVLAGEDAGVVRGQKLRLSLLFPFLFLIGHTLELAYKAILVAHGTTEKDLRKIGHNLVGCREEAQACCPGLLEGLEEPGTDEIVERIDPYYKAKAFEYHKTGFYLGLPDPPKQVVTITAGTVGNIREWVRSSVREAMR